MTVSNRLRRYTNGPSQSAQDGSSSSSIKCRRHQKGNGPLAGVRTRRGSLCAIMVTDRHGPRLRDADGCPRGPGVGPAGGPALPDHGLPEGVPDGRAPARQSGPTREELVTLWLDRVSYWMFSLPSSRGVNRPISLDFRHRRLSRSLSITGTNVLYCHRRPPDGREHPLYAAPRWLLNPRRGASLSRVNDPQS